MTLPTPLSRRQFQQTLAACSGAALAAGLPATPERADADAAETPADTSAPKAEIHEIRVIASPPGQYCGWPTLTRRSDGRLIVVWSGGREQHICPFGRLEMIHSDDDGQTWTWPRTILDGASDDRDGGVMETAKGTLLATTFTSLAYEPELNRAIARGANDPDVWPAERLQRWLGVHQRLSPEQRQAELGQWMIRSSDGGITWSERYPTIVNSPHGPVQLADGRLLYAGKRLWTEDRENGVCQSTDDGQTWTWLSEIPSREGDDPKAYHELHAVETKSGKLIVHIRNHNQPNAGETLQCESVDGGKTWTQPHSIGVWGLPSFLSKLSDGRLLMSYGYRRQPRGNQARVSSDEGQTWSPPMTISDDAPSGDVGYPSTVQLDDGTLLTVWYERMADSPYAVLRQAKWSIV